MVKIDRSALSYSTLVPNSFIDSFLAEADGDSVKVYLYLLRAADAQMLIETEEIAKCCGITKERVKNALSYLEKESLIMLFYEGQELKTVRFLSASDASSFKAKHQITRERMRQIMKEDKTAAALLYKAEKYFGRPLSQNEMRTIIYYYSDGGFSEELCDYLLQYCVSFDGKSYGYIDKVATHWQEQGIKTAAEASESFRLKGTQPEKKKENKESKPAAVNKNNKFKNFAEHEYDFDELEKRARQKNSI